MSMLRLTAVALGAPAFCLLVVLNVGGYRYGVSDQAFYVPAVQHTLDPTLYPHDAAILDAQDRFLVVDDGFAALVRLSGWRLPIAFVAVYVAGLLVLYGATVAIGRALFRTGWSVTAFVVAETLAHRIPDTAINTLEGYLHPRQLAFAVGLAGLAVFLHGRTWVALGAVGVAFLCHPPTAVWFAAAVGIAALVSDRDSRQPILAMAGAAAAAAAVLAASTLRAPVVATDPSWTAWLRSTGALEVTEWPMLTWFVNLGLAAAIGIGYDARRARGLTTPRETGLVAACATMLALFLFSVPLAREGLPVVVRLQFTRIFWLLDYVAIAYLVWAVIEGPLADRGRPGRGSRSRPADRRRPAAVWRAAVGLILIASLLRGGYATFVARAAHPVAEVDLPDSDWTAVMAWAARQPVGTHFLVDPAHARRYGSSVRVASGRDVYLEEVKDIGIAIYAPDIAARVAQRRAELGDFAALDPPRARQLARRYDLDYLITEHPLDLPSVHEHGPFHVYDLNTADRFARDR